MGSEVNVRTGASMKEVGGVTSLGPFRPEPRFYNKMV